MLLLALLSLVAAQSDDPRLGTGYSAIPLQRSGSGTNVVQVDVGEPSVPLRLTVCTRSKGVADAATNVNFILVATNECERCTQKTEVYDRARSDSTQDLQEAVDYSFIYPTSTNTMTVSGENVRDIILDARGDGAANQRMVLVDGLRDRPSGRSTTFSDGTAGFFGLGVYQTDPTDSFIPSEMLTTNEGAPSSATGFIVGFDISKYVNNQPAGTLHWGGVPSGSYFGDFNWISVNKTVGGSWGIPFDSIRVEGAVQSGRGLFATLDPGFDAIYMPSGLAESLFVQVPGASRDRDATRWNVPCNTNISMSIAISGTTYKMASSELVQRRGNSPTCWSSIVAWANGSVPEQLGEIRLGTPFLSGVYSALYYSEGEQFVAIAGKPGSVNDGNLEAARGQVNTRLAGILIGSLLGALLIVLLLVYARNRNSFQSIYYRALRREQRFQVNALVRGATVPPPGVMPPMIPVPRGPMVPMPMPYPPGYAPPVAPPYQHPQPMITRHQSMPTAVQVQPQGYYSPRQGKRMSAPQYTTTVPAPIVRWGGVGATRQQSSSESEPPAAAPSGKREAQPKPKIADMYNIPPNAPSEKAMWEYRRGSRSIFRGYEAVPRTTPPVWMPSSAQGDSGGERKQREGTRTTVS